MGFVILVVVGGILGWLASIITRSEDRQGILMNVVVGIAGAMLAGILVNRGSILIGISATALLAAFAAALLSLAIANVVRARVTS